MKDWKKSMLGVAMACSMGFGLTEASVTAFAEGSNGTRCPACGRCPWVGFHDVGDGRCICCTPQ